MKKFVMLLGIVFLFFSCQKNDLTNSDNVDNQDLMLKSGQPDQPGDNLKVFRYEGIIGWWLYDEKNGLTAFVAADVTQACSGGGISFDILNLQDIVKEGEEGETPRIHRLAKQDNVPVDVYEGEFGFICDVALAQPIFSGTADLVSTDNDYYAFERDNTNANAFGLSLHGDGISINYHAVWRGEDFSTAKENTKIMLK